MEAATVNVADFGVYPDLEVDQTEAMIAALGCLGKTVNGITYGNKFFIDRGKYNIDFARVLRSLPRHDLGICIDNCTWKTE